VLKSKGANQDAANNKWRQIPAGLLFSTFCPLNPRRDADWRRRVHNEELSMPQLEHIYAALTDGTTEEVWAILDPDKHSFAYLITLVRELVSKKRGTLPLNVTVARLAFDPAY
jgi:hypothetical protein